MAIIDISVAVGPGTVVWEDDPAPVIERVNAIAEGSAYNLSRLAFGAHTGTHVDAPLHFIDEAAPVESLQLNSLIGPALVVDARASENEIDAETIEREVGSGTERVIFATRNSELWRRPKFSRDFVGVSAQAAALLVERGVRLVGIDYLSVGSPGVHRELLGNGVIVLEGLDLRAVEAGTYELVCLPIRIAGADGAPARAVLVTV
ncbi:MAG: cyclase family protein [Gaiellaceae bacterium]